MLSSVPAVDIHSHLNHGAAHDSPENPLYHAGADFLAEAYRAANIACGAFSTFASVLDAGDIPAENEYVLRMTQTHPWIFQWVVVDPRQPETYAQADRLLDGPKCLGIKLHPAYHGYDLTEYADAVFSFAQARRAVVLTHPPAAERIAALVPFADRYPDMKLILAHLGSLAHVEAVERAANGNIFTDTSGIASSKNNVVEYAVERAGADRILFGTDTYAPGFQRGRIEYARIPEADKVRILRDNALRLFPKLIGKE